MKLRHTVDYFDDPGAGLSLPRRFNEKEKTLSLTGPALFSGGSDAPPADDPFSANVVFFMPCDGADNSVVMTELTGKLISRGADSGFGGPTIKTAQSKFSGASLLFSTANGDFLETADNDAYHFGGGDFTIELFVRPDATLGAGQYDGLLSQRTISSSNHSWVLLLNGDLGLAQFGVSEVGSGDLANCTAAYPTPLQWSHIAAVRSGSQIRLYVDGVGGGTGSVGASSLFNSTAPMRIGALNANGGNKYGGYMDMIRITKGVARYTADFSPPTTVFLYP